MLTERQSVPKSLRDSIKLPIDSKQRQFQELQSMVIEEIKSTNARIDILFEEPASKKTSGFLSRVSVEENCSQEKEEAKQTLIFRLISSEKTDPSISAGLSKILKSIVH